MTDLQLPMPAVEQTVDRGVSLLPSELASPLVGPLPPPLPASAALTRSRRTVDDTHLLQSHAQAVRATKARKRRLSLKQPKDSKVRRTVFAALALKAQGKKNDEIADACGITKNTLKTYMYRAHQRGWLNIASLEDPEDKLEIVLKSKAVRNINTILDETVLVDEETGATVPTVRAGDISLEVAKGLGLLVNHQAVKNSSPTAVAFALSVNVEMPTVGSTPVPRIGSVGGQPYFDADVVEAE